MHCAARCRHGQNPRRTSSRRAPICAYSLTDSNAELRDHDFGVDYGRNFRLLQKAEWSCETLRKPAHFLGLPVVCGAVNPCAARKCVAWPRRRRRKPPHSHPQVTHHRIRADIYRRSLAARSKDSAICHMFLHSPDVPAPEAMRAASSISQWPIRRRSFGDRSGSPGTVLAWRFMSDAIR